MNDLEYFDGYTEVLQQQSLDMAGTRGGFVMEARNLQGNLEKASFFDSIGSSIISDRDPTDMTSATWNDLSMSETVAVRTYKNAKEKKAVSAFRELGESPEVMSFVVGQQHAKGVALSYLNSGLAAATAAFTKVPDCTFDATTTSATTITPENLVRMMDKLGDGSNRVVAIVCHSKMAHDLLADQVTSSVSTIAGPALIDGTSATFGLPVLRTDSPALVDLDPAGDGTAPAQYKVLMLTENAIKITEDQNRDVLSRIDDSTANLAMQVTLEYSFQVAIKGMEYVGPNYPTDANLGDPANFNYVYSDKRSGTGVIGIFNAREDA